MVCICRIVNSKVAMTTHHEVFVFSLGCSTTTRLNTKCKSRGFVQQKALLLQTFLSINASLTKLWELFISIKFQTIPSGDRHGNLVIFLFNKYDLINDYKWQHPNWKFQYLIVLNTKYADSGIQKRLQWAFCQIRIMTGCACARNAGNVFPATAG